ncbi:sulfurtransferase [Leptolyngbya sp. FACHB-36]|uniref:sulfurtransferase n=1 Tax=Leptolyngbya sp. FACHB-36 TaxID=2692808 RepID=UPI001681015E|nr:sulfurtransferase [Leptolyngbya sp. FACHB-36]MBD2022668.1 sulfurtransferase [Leptolyngbya sp. FACHB-36]
MSVSPSEARSPAVSAEWLHAHLGAADVAIVDCRFSLMQPELGRQQYEAAHLPGAHYLDLNRDLSGPVGQHGGRHPLPDVATLASKLTAIGVQSEPPNGPTLVVAYDDSRLAFAARLWWLLRYLGHDRVAVLDGGFSGWAAAGYPVTTELPRANPGAFVPRPQVDHAVDIATVKARQMQPGVVLVDSREGDRYRGEREPIDPIAGHIPGAVNYPWQEATDDRGFLRSPAEQRQRWQAIGEAEEAIVYCGSGVTACVNLLSLELAGRSTDKLYAGSWSDWCSYC